MTDPTPVSRRRFLRDTPAAGTLLATGAIAATAASREASATQDDSNPRKPIRVGVLNISVYSHLAAHWGRLISGSMSYTNMQITHCWDVNAESSAGFARGHRCTAVKNPSDMVGHVDAVIDGGYYNHAFNHVLMAPFLKAGLPCLVNRPFANSVAKTKAIVELARKHKAPLLVPSAFGHNQVVVEARHFVESSRVTGYHTTTGAEDYPTHGTHGLYFLSRAITDAGILVFGHLGLTPQSASSFGGYRVQGKSLESFETTMEESLALEEAGTVALLLEAMPTEPAGQIAQALRIPVLGIGAGSQVDGQLVIMHDVLGLYQDFRPLFAKCYIPQVTDRFLSHLAEYEDIRKLGREERSDGLLALTQLALEDYVQEVRTGIFPGAEYCYPIEPSDLESLQRSKYWERRLAVSVS